MRRLWNILTGHDGCRRDRHDDRQRAAIDMKLDALQTGVERMRDEASRTKDAAAETERAAQALLKRLAEDFPR